MNVTVTINRGDVAASHLYGPVLNWLPVRTTYDRDLFADCVRAGRLEREAKAALDAFTYPRGASETAWDAARQEALALCNANGEAWDRLCTARRAFTQAVMAGIVSGAVGR